MKALRKYILKIRLSIRSGFGYLLLSQFIWALSSQHGFEWVCWEQGLTVCLFGRPIRRPAFGPLAGRSLEGWGVGCFWDEANLYFPGIGGSWTLQGVKWVSSADQATDHGAQEWDYTKPKQTNNDKSSTSHTAKFWVSPITLGISFFNILYLTTSFLGLWILVDHIL